MIHDNFIFFLILIIPTIVNIYLIRVYRTKKKNRLEQIDVFLRKLKTLPEPYEDLDLNFTTHLSIEDKLSFIYKLNKNNASQSFKVYRWRLNGELCFVMVMGTAMGTHLLYMHTYGNEQIVDSYSNIEDGFCLSTKELIDLIKIK